MIIESDILDLIRKLIIDSAASRGITINQSRELAESTIEQIQIHAGGGDHYIHALSKEKKHQKIREDFNGRNREEVCKKHRIGITTFYRAISKK